MKNAGFLLVVALALTIAAAWFLAGCSGRLETSVKVDSKPTAPAQPSPISLLVFWEPWCAPCLAEIRNENAIWEKYKGNERFRMAAYATKEDERGTVGRDAGMKFHSYKDDGRRKQFNATSIPCYYLYSNGSWQSWTGGGHSAVIDAAISIAVTQP